MHSIVRPPWSGNWYGEDDWQQPNERSEARVKRVEGLLCDTGMYCGAYSMVKSVTSRASRRGAGLTGRHVDSGLGRENDVEFCNFGFMSEYGDSYATLLIRKTFAVDSVKCSLTTVVV